MNRREAVALLSGAVVALPLPALAQTAARPRLGILLVGNREPFFRLFSEGLRELGYVEGQNIAFEYRSAGGKIDLLPRLAAELVGLKVNIIVASETPSVQAAKRATGDIPIVMAPSGDPVGTGLIASLARPGGNVTGLSAATAELAGKSLELIREILPNARRFAALADPANAFTKPFLEHVNAASRHIGADMEVFMVRGVGDFDAAFAEMERKKIEALVVQPTLPRPRIVELVLKHKIPAVSGNRAFADAGGLVSYAGSLADRYRNAAPYVDRILKGAKPADLPVQQPVRFELVINLKTAKAFGLTVPPMLLVRADHVIE